MNPRSQINLEPDQTAGEAVRQILSDLFVALQAPLAATLGGLDPDALHDFRVAIRRTRSGIGQLKRALPPDAVKNFAPKFKWLGTITGPCRDLDVWLSSFEAQREYLIEEDRAALEPLEDLLRTARVNAHVELVHDMRSARFQRLLEDWEGFLAEWPTLSDLFPDGDLSVQSFAGRRILKAFKRVKRRGHDLGDGLDAAALHQLRISAKKLRYLFEFFRALDQRDRIGAKIADLKKLQDVLGEFNDLEFQRIRLTAFAGELEGSTAGKTRQAIQRLRSRIEHRQNEVRLQVHDRLHPVIRGSAPVFADSLPS